MQTKNTTQETSFLLEVENLEKHFPVGKRSLFKKEETRVVKAVDGISFSLKKGETLGIVGESGCGKSTMGRAVLRLQEPTGGKIRYNGEEIQNLSGKQLKAKRRELQMIFQDPYGSLNKRMTVGAMLSEIVNTHRIVSKAEVTNHVHELLMTVGLGHHHFHRFPHEFSGGQRQRVGIARALCVNPSLVICDEAVSALDVSVQSRILNLLQQLKKEHQLTYLFISHDLSVVKHISDRVAVMYLGKIVEIANKEALYARPAHPYTKALLSAIPSTDKSKKKERVILKGEVPSPLDIPTGCRFHTRCPIATDYCNKETPELRDIGDGQLAACHYA